MRKKKTIWRKDLMTETRIGRLVSPIGYATVVLWFFYQAFSGLILDKATLLTKYYGGYTYYGGNANLIGLAYLSVILFIIPFPFFERLKKLGIFPWIKVYMLCMCLSFILTLSLAVYREAF